MDNLTRQQRSFNMSRVRGLHTQPELVVRRALHRLGLRFRLHVTTLVGKPDIVLSRFSTVVFVHGCFWHRHRGCKRAFRPSTNKAFWNKKFERNVQRDKAASMALKRAGWKVFIVWECETKQVGRATLERRLKKIFGAPLPRRLISLRNRSPLVGADSRIRQ